MTKPDHLIGYIRVSTEGQRDGFGLQVQEDRIREYAKLEKTSLLSIFRDEGVSGSLKDRPALLRLLEYADEHKEMSLGLVFLRLDRLSRSLVVSEQLLADFQNRGLTVISIEEPDLLSSDPTRKLFRQFKGMMAEYEKEMIAARMSAGRLKKVEDGKGYAGGRVAFGFRANSCGYVSVPEELAVVREIYRLRRKPRNGKRMGYQRIAKLLNEQYGHIKNFNPMTVRYIASNPFYRGYQSYGGVTVFNEQHKII